MMTIFDNVKAHTMMYVGKWCRQTHAMTSAFTCWLISFKKSFHKVKVARIGIIKGERKLPTFI